MSISINLFNNDSFYPGEIVEGIVVCIFTSRIDTRGIRLKLRGREHTTWSKSESYYDHDEKKTKTKTVCYSGNNKFFDITQNLHGGGVMNKGRYEYPFKFLLPKNIPSTYNGAHGHIRYYVKANVDVPMDLDYETERRFVVISPIDFNDILDSIELNPTQYQDETNLCCWCCASDPITMAVYLDKEAFILGEKIRLKLHINNMSNTSIDNLSVILKRVKLSRFRVFEYYSVQLDRAVLKISDKGYPSKMLLCGDLDKTVTQLIKSIGHKATGRTHRRRHSERSI